MTPFIKSHICVHVYTITYKLIHIKSYYDFVNVYKVNCKNVAQTSSVYDGDTYRDGSEDLKSFMCILLLNLI